MAAMGNEHVEAIKVASLHFYSLLEATKQLSESNALDQERLDRANEKLSELAEHLNELGVEVGEFDEGPMIGRRLWAIYENAPVPRNVDQILLVAYNQFIIDPFGHLPPQL